MSGKLPGWKESTQWRGAAYKYKTPDRNIRKKMGKSRQGCRQGDDLSVSVL